MKKTHPSTPQRPPHPAKPDVEPKTDANPELEGEGSYTAARNYRQRSEDFVASGQVEQAAEDAAPDTPQEADALKAAEEKGRAPARR